VGDHPARVARSVVCASPLALALLASLLPSPAAAQVPDALFGRPVAALRLEGDTGGTNAEALLAPLRGAPLTRAAVRAATLSLARSGAWADVQLDAVPEGAGVTLVARLTRRCFVARIDVLGQGDLTAADVVAALGISPGDEIDRTQLRELARSVADAYADRGYVDARSTLRLLDTDDPTRKVLRVTIEEGEPLRVVAYRFEGEAPPPTFDVPSAVGLGAGAVIDSRRLREGVAEATRSLRQAGWLEARLDEPRVERESGGAVIVLGARFGPRYDVRLSGYEPLTRESVETALALREERLTPASLRSIEERIVDVLRRHGFHDGTVSVRRRSGPRPGTAVLDVRLSPGRQLRVVHVSFPGAVHFDVGYLRGQLASVLEETLPDTRFFAPVDSDTLDRVGFGGRAVLPREREVRAPLEVDPSVVYHEELYAQGVEHLAELLHAEGYLGARVGPARLERVGADRAVVVVPIIEGPRTLLYGATLRGNTALSERELLEAAELTRDEPLSYLALEEAVERMETLYRERGYLFAEVETDVRFSDDRERAEVLIRVTERFVVRVGEVAIEGARRTSESLIRSVLGVEAGALYRASDLRAGQEALMALGIFSSVNIAPRDAELPARVKDLVVTVRERSLGAFDGSVGISTGQGFRGATEFDFRNVGGFALNVAVRAQLGLQFFFQDAELERNISPLSLADRLERRFGVTFSLPHLPGLEGVRGSLDLVHLRDNERAFGLDKNGLVLSFNWRPERAFSLTVSTELEQNGVQLFGDRTDINQILDPETGPRPDPRVVRLLRVPQGESFVVSARATGTLDFRDSPFSPTEGWFASLTAEWVRTLDVSSQPDAERFFSHFVKLGLTTSAYLPLGDAVLAGQLRVGAVLHLEPGSRTYPNRQWFLGGVDTLRGLNQDQLQPQDIADLQLENPELRTGTVLQGGDFFYLLRTELRFPVVGNLYGAVFVDLGNHWADPAQIRLNESFVRFTGGVGVRFLTPVGPLAFDVGFNPFYREPLGEPLAAFHFSIGVF
jgi:outer membrane protein assembly factor BamA